MDYGDFYVHRLDSFPISDRVLKIIDLCDGRSVLHLGCADAPIHEYRYKNNELLHSQIRRYASHIIGVDLDSEAVAFLRKCAGYSEIVQGNVEKLEELNLDCQFEVIVLGELLEHLSNVGMCLDKISTLLRPHGIVIISVPNAFALKAYLWALFGIERVHPDHMCYYSVNTLRALALRHGYLVKSVFYYITKPRSKIKKIVWYMLRPIYQMRPWLSDGILVILGRN